MKVFPVHLISLIASFQIEDQENVLTHTQKVCQYRSLYVLASLFYFNFLLLKESGAGGSVYAGVECQRKRFNNRGLNKET